MVLSRRIILRAVLALAGLALAGVIGAVFFAYSGLYNVAASRGHPAWLDWFLETGMRRSVQFHSSGAPAPDLNDPELFTLGAGHFQGGCAPCHGAPGQPVNPVYDHMLPSPPSLSDHVPRWEDRELFWIVKHGLQYAGMPAWSGEKRDNEVWTVVAFLRKLPSLDEDAYLALARGNAEVDATSASSFVNAGQTALHLTACARCHENGAAPVSDMVPRLAGQSAIYLQRALEEYRADQRQSGIMEPVAAELNAHQIEMLAAYYSGLPPASEKSANRDSALVEKGRTIALYGKTKSGVPPCRVCHAKPGGGDATLALPSYPLLEGQNAAYIEMQLALWREGGRNQTEFGALMGEIAQRLSEEDAAAVAAYYEAGGERSP